MLVLLFGAMIATELRSWLAGLGLDVRAADALAGDVSQRRYFRLVLGDGTSRIAAHYPEDLRAAMTRFVAARALLAGAGVRVPAVHEWSTGTGWMLVEDLGTANLFECAALPLEKRDGYFASAVEIAERIAGLNAHEVARLGSPPLDRALLRRELEPTFEFLLDPLGLSALPAERRQLLSALEELCARLAEAPLVPCHRDYMARNLVPLGEQVAVIDFQDLRLGPPAYDLASLLNDSFFPGPALEESLLPERWRSPSAREQYSRAVVQRALKAGGTFARFAARGNPRHLPLIAPTLARAARHLASLPETATAFDSLRPWWSAQFDRLPFC
jgi:hypothetical protein